MSVRSATGSLVRLSVDAPAAVDTDLLVIPIFEGESAAPLEGIDAATGGEISRALSSGEAAGRLYELFLTPIVHGWHTRRVALAGAGKAAPFDLERLRKLASAAA